MVNSKFTKRVFAEAFPGLRDREPGVIYPCVDTSNGSRLDEMKPLWRDKKVLLSINRFEKKKDVALAIKAFAGLSSSERQDVRLVIAGGFDSKIPENVRTYTELCELANSLQLRHATAKDATIAQAVPVNVSVVFLHSVPNDLKTTLLQTSRLLVYTPRHEHFGIVPLEAMLAGTPVLAANEGGPTETVISGQTGWLRNVSKTSDWTEVMRIALEDGEGEKRLVEMGQWGRERVHAEFSKEKMAERLEVEIQHMLKKQERPKLATSDMLLFIIAWIVMLVVLLCYLLKER